MTTRSQSVLQRRLAEDLVELDRMDRAVELLEESWSAVASMPSADDERPRLAASYSSLLERSGNLESAAQVSDAAWRACVARWGADNQMAIECRLRYASCVLRIGRAKEALRVAEEVESLCGADGGLTKLGLESTLVRAKCLSALDRDTEAAPVAKEAWAIASRDLGEANQVSVELGTIFVLAAWYSDEVDPPSTAQAERVWRGSKGRILDHLSTLGSLLAGHYVWAGRSGDWPDERNGLGYPSESDLDLFLAVEERLASLDPEGKLSFTFSGWRMMNAHALLRIGQRQRADEIATDGVAGARRWWDEPSLVISSSTHLVELLDEIGRPAEAIPIAERRLEALRSQPDDDSTGLHLLARYELGRVLRNSGTPENLDRAVELLGSTFADCTAGEPGASALHRSIGHEGAEEGFITGAALALARLTRADPGRNDIEAGSKLLARSCPSI